MFAYCGNNPVNRKDPTGQFWIAAGQEPSRWNALDGAAIAWDLGNIMNYYNTETVYFAVTR